MRMALPSPQPSPLAGAFVVESGLKMRSCSWVRSSFRGRAPGMNLTVFYLPALNRKSIFAKRIYPLLPVRINFGNAVGSLDKKTAPIRSRRRIGCGKGLAE